MDSLPSLPNDGGSIQSFLKWEESIISAVANDHELESVWGVWQARQGLCMTAKEKRLPNYEKAKAQLEDAGIEIAIRRTGGTTVPHGPGIVSITNITTISGKKDIQQAYMRFCSGIQKSLTSLGFDTTVGAAPGAYCDGDYNILIDDKKLAGTSQRWKQTGINTAVVLSHAVMLISCDAATATQRVNDFHILAEGDQPYNSAATTSLWESQKSRTQLNKAGFLNHVIESFNSLS